MYAIVKFKNSPTPEIFGINNSGYAYHLSTMDNVEWVCAATIAYNGTITPATDDKVFNSMLREVVIKPFLPGDADPLARFREGRQEDEKKR